MATFKVLHVIRPAAGGMKNHLLTLIAKANRDLFELTVACPPGDIARDVASLGIDVIPIPLRGELSPGTDITSIRILASALKERNITILHAHSSKAGLVGRLAAALAGTPVIIMTAHNSIFYEDWPNWKKNTFAMAERLLAGRTDLILTVSNALRDELLAREGLKSNKVVTVYNGIEPEHFTIKGERLAILKSLGLPPLGKVVGTIARLAPQKGIKYFLQAAAILAKRCQANFLVVGDGPLRKELEEEAAALGLQRRVVFTGERRDIPNILPVFDVFVLPSLTEGFPLTILEAMAAARPTVATSVGGIPEAIINNYTGILVPPRDPVELARSITILLKDYDKARRYGEAAHKELMQRFTTDKMVQQTELLYRRVLTEKQMLPVDFLAECDFHALTNNH